MPSVADPASPASRYPAMKPTAWLLAYCPVLKRSMPSTTYRRQRPASCPATRLHSMIACGSCSSYSSRMSLKRTGISVSPSGFGTSDLESDSAPGRMVIFLRQAASVSFNALRIPRRRCSVISTSPAPACTSEVADARLQPSSRVHRIAPSRSWILMMCRPRTPGREEIPRITSHDRRTRCRRPPRPRPPDRTRPTSAGGPPA